MTPEALSKRCVSDPEIIVVSMPKVNITGSVPLPNAKSIFAPSSALPVPAAITYIACKGPGDHQSIQKPNHEGLMRRV